MSPLALQLRRPLVAILVITAAAAVLRFWSLGSPKGFVFDEVYYAKVACIYVGSSNDVCHVDSKAERNWRRQKWDVGSWVHPPLGKWMTAAGIKAFGMDATGWRFASAVSGTLIVAGVATIAYLLFASVAWTYVAGLLMIVESLNHVHARLALLDVHLEMWVVAGFLFLALDRRWIDGRTPDPPPEEPISPDEPVVASRSARYVPSPVWRPWRFAAGCAFGAATAVKWSGITALAAAVVLSYAWETTRRHRADVGVPRAFGGALMAETFGLVLAFALVPLAVYTAAWIPWFNHYGWSVGAWWHEHAEIWNYHGRTLSEFAEDGTTGSLTPTHPYYSRAWEWIPMLRPVSYFVKDLGPDIRQILGIGNPVVFWAAVWTLPYVGFMWWRRRDWRCGYVLVPFLMMWLPWLAVRRPQFFFYVLPMTPFLVLAAAYVLRDLWSATVVLRDADGVTVESSKHPYRPLVWIYVGLAVGMFVWFYPVLTAGQISDTMWKLRVWFPGWV